MDEKESEELAKAISGVMEQYEIKIDPKVAAWVTLAYVGAGIYGPRIVAARIEAVRAAKEKQAREANETTHVRNSVTG